MALINEHFLKLQNNYLFSDIAKKVNSFKVTHPKDKIIRMGIGDVTQPLAPAVIEAMHKAVEEMASKDTFHGYGPEQGYPFLIDAIIKNDYASRAISAIRSFTIRSFSSSGRSGSNVSTSATYVSVYCEVSSQLICTMAR